MTLMSMAEEKRLKKAAKKAKQEQQPTDQDQQLRNRLARLLQEHGRDLADDEERDFVGYVSGVSGALLTSERTRAVLLLARFQNGNGKANGHAPAVAGDAKKNGRHAPDFGDDVSRDNPEMAAMRRLEETKARKA